MTAMSRSNDNAQLGLDLARQQRNLLLLRPLFELALKTRRGDASEPLFSGLDTNYLALALLDFIMEGGVLGLGRALHETLTHGADLVRRMKPALSEQDARRTAREVLDTLHNASGKYERFEYEYFDAATGKPQRYAFALLRYERAEDDQYYYRVSDEGFLVYLGMLDLGAANMQELMEKMLHELVRRGRVNEAVDVSRQAYLQAARYVDSIRARLDRAHRVPDSVTWKGDLENFLTEARDHLDKRQSEERQLLAVVTDKLREGEDPSTREKLVRLKDTVEAELHLGSRLLNLIGEAGQSYLRAQAALFRARVRQNLPDLEERLLPELLGLTVQQLHQIGEDQGHSLFGAAVPKLFSLGAVLDLLLEPQPDVVVPETPEAEIVRLEELPPHFTPEDSVAANQFLRDAFTREPTIDIEAILAQAKRAGLQRQVRELMTFRMYQAYSREESSFPVDARAEGRFANDLVEGVKLTFTRREQEND
jgi:hypothetical protein